TLLKYVDAISNEMLEGEHTPNTQFATGGIVTKLKAADFLLKREIPMYLSSGFDLKYAEEFLVNNNHIGGTVFKKEK
ncbi:MAG: glutamate 5-kinase, partial [Arcobacteraceae bacterium]